MTTIIFGGAEHPTWRRKLIEWGAEAVALNFNSLRKRLPTTKRWDMAAHFPDHVRVALYLPNCDDRDIIAAYRRFLDEHGDRVWFAVEPDALPLAHREALRVSGPWVPMWAAEDGSRSLTAVCEEFGELAVSQETLEADGGAGMARIRNAVDGGAIVHGIGVSKLDVLTETPLLSALTSSWRSPAAWGETQIWDGSTLHRYDASNKAIRSSYAAQLGANGFDVDKILCDDKDELSRLAVWSWLQLGDHLARSRPVVATAFPARSEETSVTVRTAPTTAAVNRGSLNVRTPTVLPGIAVVDETKVDADGVMRTTSAVTVTGASAVRACASCSLANICPSFDATATCAYEIPVSVTTKDQLVRLNATFIEMQAQRIFMARFAEELRGVTDKGLSEELDRFTKMVAGFKDLTDNRDTLKISAEVSAGAGVLSRLFGADVGVAARQLPGGPMDANDIDRLAADVLDVEPVAGAEA